MKIRALEAILVLALLFVTVFNSVAFAIGSFSYNLNTLPEGVLKNTVPSPLGEKNLQIYLVDIEDVGSGIRGVVTDSDGSAKRVICWKTGTANCSAKWLNENLVVIDGTEINLLGDPFDSRTNIELPEGSAKSRTLEQK